MAASLKLQPHPRLYLGGGIERLGREFRWPYLRQVSAVSAKAADSFAKVPELKYERHKTTLT